MSMPQDDWEMCSCGERKMIPGSYICGVCENELESPPLKRDAPKLVGEREHEPGPYRGTDLQIVHGICGRCEMLARCHNRLMVDPCAWVMCEIPDELDMKTAQLELLQ